MDKLGVVERGYEAVAAADRDTLQDLFSDDAVWEAMDGTEVARRIEGRDAIVDFLLRFQDLRLEAIMSFRDLVVSAHSFTQRSGTRVVATTLFEVPDRLVTVAHCSDVMR